MTSDRRGKAENILKRRTSRDGVYPSLDDVLNRLAGEESLSFYAGYDPTGGQLHAGHTVTLLLLKELARDLGHSVIVLYGDFTARIGDPTDKTSTRRALSEEEVEDYMKTWDNQVSTIFGDVPYTIKHNSEWLSAMSFTDVIKLSSKVTVQQMLVRDMFQERLKTERPIYLNEFLYPLAQGYDSVVMRVDGEIGGSEQTFNMLVGREFSKEFLGKDKMVLTTPLIVDSKTGKKMSKSEGEIIGLTDSPQEIRRKVLDIDDGLIRSFFELCTEKDQSWIDEYCPKDQNPAQPREAKEELAVELVRMYHGEEAVDIMNQPTPSEAAGLPLLEALVDSGVKSSSAAKTLIKQGAVQINDKVVDRWDIVVKEEDNIKIGKGKILKVR